MLQTSRLHLRRWRDGDAETFARINADARVMEYFPACLTAEESLAFLRRIEDKFARVGFGLWALEIRETGEFIGYTGLNVPDFTAAFTPCVEIGWRLAFAHWGKGYASEAARAALEYGFTQAGLEEILSWTYEGNTRSINVMRRIGMVQDAGGGFAHPSLPAAHKLSRHVLYRIRKPKE